MKQAHTARALRLIPPAIPWPQAILRIEYETGPPSHYLLDGCTATPLPRLKAAAYDCPEVTFTVAEGVCVR